MKVARVPIVSVFLCLVLAVPAFAAVPVVVSRACDAANLCQVLISQSCALGTGCFAGDAPGFPVTITTPGYYRLVSNLKTESPNDTLIAVTANDVTLDLGGFAIGGPTTCTEYSFDCSPTGSGIGIEAGQVENLAIMNGTIRGMGSDGVDAGSSAKVTGLRVIENGGEGMGLGSHSVVTDCLVIRNRLNGILTRAFSLVTGTSSTHNGFNGIYAAEWSLVAGCTASTNQLNGIATGCASSVRQNNASANGQDGINSCGNMAIVDNTAVENHECGISYGSGVQERNLTVGNGMGGVCGGP